MYLQEILKIKTIHIFKIKNGKKSLVESKEHQPFLMMFLTKNILDTKLNCGLYRFNNQHVYLENIQSKISTDYAKIKDDDDCTVVF